MKKYPLVFNQYIYIYASLSGKISPRTSLCTSRYFASIRVIHYTTCKQITAPLKQGSTNMEVCHRVVTTASCGVLLPMPRFTFAWGLHVRVIRAARSRYVEFARFLSPWTWNRIIHAYAAKRLRNSSWYLARRYLPTFQSWSYWKHW